MSFARITALNKICKQKKEAKKRRHLSQQMPLCFFKKNKKNSKNYMLIKNIMPDILRQK